MKTMAIFGETRDSVTPQCAGLSQDFQGLFQGPRKTAHLPSARLEPAERRT